MVAMTPENIIWYLFTIFISLNDVSCYILRLPCGNVFADFVIFEADLALKGFLIREITNTNDVGCMLQCIQSPPCKSYNINREKMICQLNSKALGENGVALSSMKQWVYKSTDYNNTLVGQTCRRLRPCNKGSVCKDICDAPYYECVHCDDEHFGLNCEYRKDGNYCLSSPCQNGGKCSNVFDEYRCVCEPGFTGVNCEIDIDECDSLPCFNGGNCTNMINGFHCACIDFYVGVQCEKFGLQSCNDIYKNVSQATGTYHIASGQHYCVMDPVSSCGEGGWTLAMTLVGSSDSFKVDSANWTDGKSYSTQEHLNAPWDKEAKYPAFLNVNFTRMCVGMRKSDTTNWLQIDASASSLHDMFSSGQYIPTTLGRTKWIAFGHGGSLQQNCNREGINVQRDGNVLKVRIGIMGNGEGDCRTPDTAISLGWTQTSCGSASYKSLTCYILVQ